MDDLESLLTGNLDQEFATGAHSAVVPVRVLPPQHPCTNVADRFRIKTRFIYIWYLFLRRIQFIRSIDRPVLVPQPR